MYYKVELICHHEPHQCRCRHNIATEVTTEDLTANLIKCNPGLLKYIGRTNVNTNKVTEQIPQKVQNFKSAEEQREERPYRSIVEQKGLNFILRDDPVQRPNIQPALNKKPSQPTLHPPQNHPVTQQQHPQSKSPQPNNAINPHPQSKKQKQVKHYHKQLKNQSRYLSNTAFRKYFDRQCFQNYGHQNVHDKADGFVYGNYLKTYNINPHSGQNMPSNQETFYHALVTASPEKYALQTQEVKLSHNSPNKQQAGKKADETKNNLERDRLDMEKMLKDNQKHSKLQKKYDHLKLKSKEENKAVNDRIAMKSQGKPKTMTNNYISSQNIDSRYSPKELQLQSRKYIGAINPNANSNASVQPQISPKRAESILIQGQPLQPSINKSPTNKSSCNHKEGEQTAECECCLNKMKALILTLADNDPDLASRIVASAKKATLYKNFALNNYETAALNPHNYRSDGKLNVYEP